MWGAQLQAHKHSVPLLEWKMGIYGFWTLFSPAYVEPTEKQILKTDRLPKPKTHSKPGFISGQIEVVCS